MGKLFGTDGIRGIVGENLTVELAFHVGQAVAAVLTEEKGSKPTITIGKDTRISSDMLEAALMAGICSVGGDVMPLGTIPTPAVAYLTVLEQADAGIVISASHNPYEHNGIKVFNAQGYKLSDEMEARVEELILSGAPMDVKTHGEIGKRLHGMRQNQIMKILTIVTTVFLPLSLIAGWYGMNFQNMPELTAEHGYLVICIVSVVCVLVELWIFKRKKWF